MDVENVVARNRGGKFSDKLPSKEIAAQTLRNFEEFISAPEISVPRRDYSLRANVEEDEENPNLGMFLYKLSKEANDQWIRWIEEIGLENLESLFFTPEELKVLNEYKKITKDFEDEEISFYGGLENSICRATKGFSQCKISDFTLSSYSPSVDERDKLLTIRELESFGRIRQLEESPDFSFTDPKRDLDFLSPLHLSNKSRGGYLFKFASRPINLTFRITFVMNGKKKMLRLNPTSKKDYTCIEDIIYLWNTSLNEKYPGASDIEVSVLTHEDKVQYETDLRFSPDDTPNPVNYKKVDTDTPIGRRLMRSLKENPYHEWTEISWKFDNETKVALYRKSPKGGVFWLYLDEQEIVSRGSKNYRKIIYPQVTERYDTNIHTGIKYIIMKNVRVSNYDNLNPPFNFIVKSKFETIINQIIDSGFVFVSKSQPDIFDTNVYSFVRNDLLTVKQRYLERTKDDR